ncbi:hypothetical protein I4F81_009083 [Pyropia yezoensis]|uniref:Uncharacterized protein n=1 Tax=Pyropia yezoensis TaxID=2788 RepID=A0ACC3C8R3_PYRYE|nr:hypothetical protein I4F81_009083 [Neopyropia yezoensis]
MQATVSPPPLCKRQAASMTRSMGQVTQMRKRTWRTVEGRATTAAAAAAAVLAHPAAAISHTRRAKCFPCGWTRTREAVPCLRETKSRRWPKTLQRHAGEGSPSSRFGTTLTTSASGRQSCTLRAAAARVAEP